MPLDALSEQIRSQVAALGFELADLRQVGTRERPILQVRIDRPDSRPGHGVTADDCGTVSRSLERYLESAGLVGPRYVLEVSSPGLERPLRWPEHWRRFVGRQVRLRSPAVPGRPTAEIVDVPDDDHVRLRLADGTETTLALADVREANLVVEWKTQGRE
jgi:ribosome maturation factor RimP